MVDLLTSSHSPHHTCVCSRVLANKQKHMIMLCRVAVLMHVLNFDFIFMMIKLSLDLIKNDICMYTQYCVMMSNAEQVPFIY